MGMFDGGDFTNLFGGSGGGGGGGLIPGMGGQNINGTGGSSLFGIPNPTSVPFSNNINVPSMNVPQGKPPTLLNPGETIGSNDFTAPTDAMHHSLPQMLQQFSSLFGQFGHGNTGGGQHPYATALASLFAGGKPSGGSLGPISAGDQHGGPNPPPGTGGPTTSPGTPGTPNIVQSSDYNNILPGGMTGLASWLQNTGGLDINKIMSLFQQSKFPGFQQASSALSNQYGAANASSGSEKALGESNLGAQYAAGLAGTEAGLFEQQAQNQMNIFGLLEPQQATWQANQPSTWDIISNVLGTGATLASMV